MIVLVATEVLKITLKKTCKLQQGFFPPNTSLLWMCFREKVKMSMYENSDIYNDFKIFFLFYILT